MKKQLIKDDDYLNLLKEFEKMDKVILKIIGKPCKEFMPKCPVCKGYLLYNKFKQDLFEEYT